MIKFYFESNNNEYFFNTLDEAIDNIKENALEVEYVKNVDVYYNSNGNIEITQDNEIIYL